jgi:hypothetical protein
MKPRGRAFPKNNQYGLATRFVKGVCSNPLGRARSKEIGAALRDRCAQTDPLDAAERTYAMEIADVWIAAGLDGNVNAIAEITSRLEGRPATKVVVGDGDDNLKKILDICNAKSVEFGPPEDDELPQLTEGTEQGATHP